MKQNIKTWIESTAIKVAKTMAQTAVGVIGSTAMISQVDWSVVVSTVALSGIVCVLMNIANLETE